MKCCGPPARAASPGRPIDRFRARPTVLTLDRPIVPWRAPRFNRAAALDAPGNVGTPVPCAPVAGPWRPAAAGRRRWPQRRPGSTCGWQYLPVCWHSCHSPAGPDGATIKGMFPMHMTKELAEQHVNDLRRVAESRDRRPGLETTSRERGRAWNLRRPLVRWGLLMPGRPTGRQPRPERPEPRRAGDLCAYPPAPEPAHRWVVASDRHGRHRASTPGPWAARIRRMPRSVAGKASGSPSRSAR